MAARLPLSSVTQTSHAPTGQLKAPDMEMPVFEAAKRFDRELEMGAIVGTPFKGRVCVQEADDIIFGYVLLNDWSARD